MTLCEGSCQGFASCRDIGETSNSVSNTYDLSLGVNSCQGTAACFRISTSNRDTISIGDGSCVGASACMDLAMSSQRETSIYIGDGSCIGDVSCLEAGLYAHDCVTIGSDSCIGQSACLRAGFDSEKVTIGDNACVGSEDGSGYSCYNFAFNGDISSPISPTYTVIGDGACIGDSTLDTPEICQSCYSNIEVYDASAAGITVITTVTASGDDCVGAFLNVTIT